MTGINEKQMIEKAERLAREFKRSYYRVGKGDRSFKIEGVDPNEVKKVYAYFCHTNSLKRLKALLDKLPDSAMCRTNKTKGYYSNIRGSLEKQKIYNLTVTEAKAVFGWACRLI